MADHESILKELGFTADADLAAQLQDDANDPSTGDGSLSHNGDYKVLNAWTKGELRVHLERNTAPEDAGDDMTAVVTHPPLLVVERGDQRLVVVSPRDTDALRAVLTEIG